MIFWSSKGTKVEWRFTEQGEKVRVSQRTGHIIPIPLSASETIDFKTRAGYPGKQSLSSFNIAITTLISKIIRRCTYIFTHHLYFKLHKTREITEYF